MFDEISLKKIDAKYFNIILLDNKDITLQSRNTGHYWYLHCTEYPEEQSLIIFHKHFFKCPYVILYICFLKRLPPPTSH